MILFVCSREDCGEYLHVINSFSTEQIAYFAQQIFLTDLLGISSNVRSAQILDSSTTPEKTATLGIKMTV